MATGAKPEQHADFFVHPDYHRLTGVPVAEEVGRYEAALQQRIDDSPLPILIYNPDPNVRTGDFWNCFPDQQRFQTLPGKGEPDASTGAHNKLNRLLDEHEILSGVVHGSYLEFCVSAFKARLSANSKTGILYVRSPSSDLPIGDVYSPESVKYGVVLRLLQSNFVIDSPEDRPPEYYAEDSQIFAAHIGVCE